MLSKYGGSMLSQVKLASNRMRPRLAIIAHDGKKADLVAFATFNRSRLQEYDIVATGATGDLLRDKVGLEVPISRRCSESATSATFRWPRTSPPRMC